MDHLTHTVLRRFLAFKYQPKESKQSKVERLWKLLREQTGIGRGVAEDIADAVVRNRDLEGLKYQKGWPLEGGMIVGPTGTIPIIELQLNLKTATSETQKYLRKWPRLGLEAYAIQSSMTGWPMVVHLEGRTDRVRDLINKTDARRVRRSWAMSSETADKLFQELDARENSV